MNESELLELKKEVEDAKSSISELTGQRKAMIKQLQDDWKCKTKEEARKKLKVMQDDLIQVENSIDEGMKELVNKYNLK